ncbi:hypothetical protein FE394_11145 [Xenorhabdus sp. Reich]|uniref:Uncharacterized protein n=1 Tax=Xenorhabdus littoralis TaxID=2582835 RepID=A0ABU4SM70_9GAMM|nr:hypothetical protein [Xenorhabdus sp. Reich]MDX7999748.1 hypothetical protein [Xenorhabdus sp. Reich]
MLKRTNSFDGYINKTSTDSISRSKSFNTLPPDNLLNINININNPRLINGYIPVVRETNKQETINKLGLYRLIMAVICLQESAKINDDTNYSMQNDKILTANLSIQLAVYFHEPNND